MSQVSGSTPLCSTKGYYVYILKSLKDGKLYTGVTQNLNRRLIEHNIGKNRATKHRRPFTLLHYECYETRAQALKRERYLKTPKGAFEKFQIGQRFEAQPMPIIEQEKEF